MAKYVPLRVAVERLGMHPNTLRRYAEGGKIDYIKNEAGQRLFDVDGYIGKTGTAIIICYARVSSRHQSNDLPRQRDQLLSSYPGAEVVTDIGSGLNFKRKGLLTILERLMQGDKLTLVVAHKDRLARFGFDLIKWMVERNGGKIVVLNAIEHSPQQELVSDLLAIITVFGARVNGLRRYGKEIKEDSAVSDQATAADD
jgi:predicted site-specific integrase-resolvase